MLGLYAFAGYRLMPALQQAFTGIASARFNIAALDAINHGLEGDAGKDIRPNESQYEVVVSLKDRLVFDRVSFTYPAAKEAAIRDLSFEIPARTTVGFVGKTGSGKTTTIDLILGLLRPQEGTISVDGTPLQGDAIRRWQRNIGYVPQHIYLSDDTVARNIAFGVAEDEIDLDAVCDAARRAHIAGFIESDLPEQWDTIIGERGVKLSGGQRQRIGIARALYKRTSVLVFDEATSALDQDTESKVMEAIYDLEGKHTIIIIAHRLSTVRRVDKIVMLENGSGAVVGTYQDLSRDHQPFRSIAL